jgi:hypothetical protein
MSQVLPQHPGTGCYGIVLDVRRGKEAVQPVSPLRDRGRCYGGVASEEVNRDIMQTTAHSKGAHLTTQSLAWHGLRVRVERFQDHDIAVMSCEETRSALQGICWCPVRYGLLRMIAHRCVVVAVPRRQADAAGAVRLRPQVVRQGP